MKTFIVSDFTLNSDKYNEWSGGVYWKSTLSLDSFCDVIMHLLFLGVTKASRDLLLLWMNGIEILREYQSLTKNLFESISDIGLEWCKIITSESGWVSDNYLAYARVMKWIHHLISILQLEEGLKEDYVEPDIPVEHWYAKMCKDWLKAHGIKCNGYVSELKAKIKSLKENVESPQKLQAEEKCDITVVDNFIGSFVSTIANIMTRVVDDDIVIQVDREIKIYLSNLNIFEKSISALHYNSKIGNKNIYWLKKYNFMSLLNIPDAMRRYGPLINLWEGSNQGEGYLRYAKPRITDIHSKNWQINAHIKLLNETSMNNVIDCHLVNRSSTYQNSEYMKNLKKKMMTSKKMFHTCKSINEVFSLYRRNMPLSCVKCENGKYLVVIACSGDNTLRGMEISFKHRFVIPNLSMHFHEMKMDISMSQFDLILFQHTDIANYIMVLPELSIRGYLNIERKSLYYIIDSAWNELNEKMEMTTPKSPGCKYQ